MRERNARHRPRQRQPGVEVAARPAGWGRCCRRPPSASSSSADQPRRRWDRPRHIEDWPVNTRAVTKSVAMPQSGVVIEPPNAAIPAKDRNAGMEISLLQPQTAGETR